MGFNFSYICDLLSSLDANRTIKATATGKSRDPDVATVTNWFRVHEKKIHGGDTDYVALLSCLFPELRPDRVHGFKEPALVKIIGRCLLLGATRWRELEAWKTPGRGDLAECVERVMADAENELLKDSPVTVEEIDSALTKIASRCRFSAPDVRRQRTAIQVDEALKPIFRRLTSRDAKWFTRLLLREYTPVNIPQRLSLRKFHFMLPAFLSVQSSLKGALEAMDRGPVKRFPPCPDPEYGRTLMELAIPHLAPQVGVKVGRPEYYKARNLRHCCRMADKRLMSIERKYDGEYCQVHIDLEMGPKCIRIFSKSGKDSTVDRKNIHTAIKDSLRIRKPGCRFSKRCILEGELLVWSDITNDILPFHHLRRHIMRAGAYIGTESDSPPDPREHLYIIFFDLLLLDDDVALSKPYRERRALLEEVVNPIHGLAGIATQFNIDFSVSSAYEHLKEEFALVSAQKWEGLVLKGVNEPYFRTFSQDTREFSCCWMKFKKESIPGLGDTADFILLGGRYDSREAAALGHIKGLSWTSFFVGCLDDDVDLLSLKPAFRVIDILNKQNINTNLFQTLNQLGKFQACDADSDDVPFSFRVDQVRIPEIQTVFRIPFVVEMTGFGFDKPQGVRYYSLRFPRIVKIHSDRDYEAAVSFRDLQGLARIANAVPVEELSQEAAELAEKLDPADKKPEYIVDHSENSATTVTASSAANSSQPLFAENNPIDPQGLNQAAVVKATSHTSEQELSLRTQRGSSTINCVNTQENSNETVSNLICILPDTTETFGEPLHSKESPGRELADITNPSEDKSTLFLRNDSCHNKPQPAKRVPFYENMQPNASFPSDRFPMDPVPQRALSFQSYHSHNSNDKCSLETMLTRSSSDISGRNNRPNAMKGSPILKLPVFLGSSLSDTTISLLRRYIPSCRSSIAPSSIPRWLTSLVSLENGSVVPPLYGIILVDSNSRHSSKVAAELRQVGRALTSLQQQNKLPNTGKIIFMHWKVVGQEFNAAKAGECLSDRWQRFGKDVIDVCIKWGHEESPECENQQAQRLPNNSLGSQSEKLPKNLCCRRDWTEILPLLQPNTLRKST
ncbi:TPA_exp: ATP dependent DNA ligase domain protein [Trichophyton benhamiae CBS 112371]|uniref:ATP dependent DNA ligase domain protein n=1 Tax=Arthroderma benhamiae (strain ATCC MYA-4681 / CBS 112371) TaxID=663331 RepID=D4AQX2_ARTBC|nr:ATP dependent DNA ligase domain protein [Trichophyton benhamiae CBS 112371]EFE34401.1 ATP dependent DNA ligase domain protein [Trichophyton benhamiae CBS 112371]DAA77342.1 TPA_exp: ATP dependent DNA ligase domain protein [Trichophyton benhamiae CBS 112371]